MTNIKFMTNIKRIRKFVNLTSKNFNFENIIFKKQEGSLAIESLMVMSMLMLILFTGIGLIYAEKVETDVLSEMMNISKDMSVAMMVPLNTTKLESRILATETLNIWGNHRVEDAFETNALMSDIQSHKSYMDNAGIYFWTLSYKLKLPLLTIKREITLPVSAVFKGQVISENDVVVFITRTGECYHAPDCFHLRLSKIKTTKATALEEGYRACQNCLARSPQVN